MRWRWSNGTTRRTTGQFANEAREGFLSELIVGGINWLADHQNTDGGWGDTDKSHSQHRDHDAGRSPRLI